MRRLALLLLLALPARAGRVDELIALLENGDPSLRRAAQAELLQIGAAAVEPVLGLIESVDPDVRRFARRLVGRQLRAGRCSVRRRILEVLVERGKGALGFIPELEELGSGYGGELGFLARVASMKIAGTRQHVRYLAARPEAYEILMAFDPEHGPVLRATYRHFERQGRTIKEIETYLDLIAAADAASPVFLAERVDGSEGEVLLMWLDIASHLTRWPREIGPAFARRLGSDSGRILAAVADTLLRGPSDWTVIAPALIETVLARVGHTVDFTRTHLILIAARCGRGERVRWLLENESKQTTASGLAALCALRASGDMVADPVARLAALDGPKRKQTLSRLVIAGAHECVPVFLDRLTNGDEHERGVVLGAADAMPAARELLPGLAEVAETGRPEEVHRAVTAAARTDGRLAWKGTEAIVLLGLTHVKGVVRGKAVYACDELKRLTPAIVSTLERLAQDREVATAMAWFLPNVRRLGRRAELMVPMLAGIVRRGPPAGLIWGGKSAVRWRRECLRALAEIRPMHPLARAAFRDGIASSDRLTRIFALGGFLRLERPEQEDYAAVRRAMNDKNQGVRRAAGIVLMSPSWQQARWDWKDR